MPPPTLPHYRQQQNATIVITVDQSCDNYRRIEGREGGRQEQTPPSPMSPLSGRFLCNQQLYRYLVLPEVPTYPINSCIRLIDLTILVKYEPIDFNKRETNFLAPLIVHT